MSAKRLLTIAAVGVLLVALVLGAGLIISKLTQNTPRVELPSAASGPAASTQAGDSAAENSSEPLPVIAITADTVRGVVRALERPAMYSRKIEVESFWDGGSGKYTVEANVNAENSSLVINGGGGEKHVIIYDGKLYIWYGGSSSFYTGAISGSGSGEADEYQMLVTWEDIAELPDGAVTDAGYAEYNGEYCIFADYTSGELGYRTVCYISAKNGLVSGAVIYDGETEIYRMSAGELASLSADAFRLPDGTELIPAA